MEYRQEIDGMGWPIASEFGHLHGSTCKNRKKGRQSSPNESPWIQNFQRYVGVFCYKMGRLEREGAARNRGTKYPDCVYLAAHCCCVAAVCHCSSPFAAVPCYVPTFCFCVAACRHCLLQFIIAAAACCPLSAAVRFHMLPFVADRGCCVPLVADRILVPLLHINFSGTPSRGESIIHFNNTHMLLLPSRRYSCTSPPSSFSLLIYYLTTLWLSPSHY
ncbi:hypothetical protein EUGRSUZ_A02643 [Eucalyptus grandis]|uniref:Uncharacterized protein n=2 Tax=Eucalyptus grandis TaxID=71139 RepID=A0ACC3M7Z7_EUCGR|nr:hypothetical protein EUGRSUZ_A02643 [Eucalyptus grandis]